MTVDGKMTINILILTVMSPDPISPNSVLKCKFLRRLLNPYTFRTTIHEMLLSEISYRLLFLYVSRPTCLLLLVLLY